MAQETRERLAGQSCFIPRIGEMVLCYWEIAGELRIEPATGQLKVWDGKAFSGHPNWLCGVVAQVPIIDEPIQPNDIDHETKKTHNVNSSGFRIECYPDPDLVDKSFSKHYKHVPLHHIRPMAFFLDVTKGIPNTAWHPTIYNAMKAMCSVSCIDRYKLKGTWPDFHMYHQGLFFGAEAYWINDPIRLIPHKDHPKRITEVLILEKAIVRTCGVKPDADGTITGNSADRIELVVQGQVYTTDIKYSKGNIVTTPPTSILHPYGPWYYIESSNDKYEIQYQHTIGRLFEYEAMQRYYPNISPSTALSAGLGSITFLRNCSSTNGEDNEGSNKKSKIFWGDHRAEALDLTTFNGVDVGIYDFNRDPVLWRRSIEVLRSQEKVLERGQIRVPKVVISSARSGGVVPSAIQPIGKVSGIVPSTVQPVQRKEVIELDSDSEEEEEEEVHGLGDDVPSNKRARVQ